MPDKTHAEWQATLTRTFRLYHLTYFLDERWIFSLNERDLSIKDQASDPMLLALVFLAV